MLASSALRLHFESALASLRVSRFDVAAAVLPTSASTDAFVPVAFRRGDDLSFDRCGLPVTVCADVDADANREVAGRVSSDTCTNSKSSSMASETRGIGAAFC